MLRCPSPSCGLLSLHRINLQPGDRLSAKASPVIASKGIDVEAVVTAVGNGVLLSQGDSKNGWALHFTDGKPSVTLVTNGQASTVSAAAPAAYPARVRLFIPGNGTLSLGVAGQNEITISSPFPAGFPTQPDEGLAVGESSAAIDGSKPFDGTLAHAWVTLLP